MALNPIFWLARWATTPVLMPVFLITSILLMTPVWWLIVSLWIHNQDLWNFNKGYLYVIRMIPFFNYAYILICWLINVFCHLIADLFNGDMFDFDPETYTYKSTGESVGGLRAFPLKSA